MILGKEGISSPGFNVADVADFQLEFLVCFQGLTAGVFTSSSALCPLARQRRQENSTAEEHRPWHRARSFQHLPRKLRSCHWNALNVFKSSRRERAPRPSRRHIKMFRTESRMKCLRWFESLGFWVFGGGKLAFPWLQMVSDDRSSCWVLLFLTSFPHLISFEAGNPIKRHGGAMKVDRNSRKDDEQIVKR